MHDLVDDHLFSVDFKMEREHLYQLWKGKRNAVQTAKEKLSNVCFKTAEQSKFF